MVYRIPVLCPQLQKQYPSGYRKVIKNGINRLKVLADRQVVVISAIDIETDFLENQGYNPIIKLFTSPTKIVDDIAEAEDIETLAVNDQSTIAKDDRSLSTLEDL